MSDNRDCIMDEQEPLELLKKYEANKCTALEKAVVESWLLHRQQTAPKSQWDATDEELKAELWTAVAPFAPIKRRLPVSIRYAAAIAAIVGITATYYYFSNHHNTNIKTQIAKEILPGGNSATLTLANGKKIDLNATNGRVITNPDVLISNNSGNGILTYQLTNSRLTHEIHEKMSPEEMNTISTPRGGQYQLILPDGTRVYLNSASTIHFPSQFAVNERKVSLIGEAYFEVAKNPQRPFLVTTREQQLKVLGTHFNVSAYPDELLKTTLAEGSVELTNLTKDNPPSNASVTASGDKQLSVVLKPDQQAMLLSTGGYQVSHVDAIEATAWKDGMFIFKGTRLGDALRQIGRWYDLEIDYINVGDQIIYAEFPRSYPLSKVLHSLEFTSKVKFKVEGRSLSVIK
jgi:transmembrane sensor